MADIFISHIHEDTIAATGLKRFIEAKFKRAKLHPAPRIFVSSSELQLGDEWLETIRSAFKSARIVIALFSPEAVTRPWVNFEAGGAWFNPDKKLVPLCIGGRHPAKLPKPYSNIQGADLNDRDAPYYLIEAIWNILNPHSLTPPPFWEDEDVAELREELERWEVASRASASRKRAEIENSSE